MMRPLYPENLRCRKCNRVARLRVYPVLADLAQQLDPEQPVQTYQCACGNVYDIPARAFQRAA